MSTAAVGLSPKMVVRSLTDERGSAEAPSSRRVSVVTLPLALPPAGGVVTVVLVDPLAPPDGGVVTVVLVEPLALPLAPPAGGVVAAEPLGLAGLLPV